MPRSLALVLAALAAAPAAGVTGPDPVPPVSRPSSRPAAFINVTLIDGTGAGARTGMTVLVSGSDIQAVGPTASLRLPAGVRRIDATGKFLIPGLWDMHAHLAKAGEQSLGLFLANGVTSVRDMGGDFETVLRWREEVASGARLGPRIRTPGPIVESERHVQEMIARKTIEPVERTRRAVATAEDAVRVVRELAALRVDFVKVRTVQTPETYRAIIRAAQDHGLEVAAHAAVDLESMIDSGQRTIEHPLIPPLDGKTEAERGALFRRMAEAGIAVVPTLVTGARSLLVPVEEAARVVEDKTGQVDPRRRYLFGYLIDDWREQLGERHPATAAAIQKLVPGLERDLTEMRRAGVRVLPGTDVAVLLIYPGFTLHDELDLLVARLGMSPGEAIQAATRQSAEVLGLGDRVGTVAPGRAADLVLLDANPLDDIAHTRRIAGVVTGGRVLMRPELDQLLADVEGHAQRGR